MTELFDRREAGARRDEGRDWQKTLLGIAGSVLAIVMVWMINEASSARTKMQEQIGAQAERIAVVEESNRNIIASQQRIEVTLDDIRRQLQQDRRSR